MPIKVFIVEDHLVVRLGWEGLLDARQFEIVGHVTSMTEAIEEIPKWSPDVVLLDVRLTDGIAFRKLRTHHHLLRKTPTIIVTAFDNPTYIAQAIALGAVDAHSKGESKSQIETAIRAAVERRGPTGADFISVQRFLNDRSRMPAQDLSRRETQVLRHLAYGLNNHDIGASLGITEDTIKEHVHNIYCKLSIKDRAAAAVWAINNLLNTPASRPSAGPGLG